MQATTRHRTACVLKNTYVEISMLHVNVFYLIFIFKIILPMKVCDQFRIVVEMYVLILSLTRIS